MKALRSGRFGQDEANGPTTVIRDGFVDAVKKCQAAGITPVAVGGQDEWPVHFYTAMLMMRILGKEGMEGSVATLQGPRDRLAGCFSWPLRFAAYSSGANLNRR